MATEANGFFDATVVYAYLFKEGDLYERMDVEYWCRASLVQSSTGQTVIVPVDGSSGATSESEEEYLYLDVGCWTGNGPKSNSNHQRHREFGVVLGNMAVLCCFEHADVSSQQKVLLGPDVLLELNRQHAYSFYWERIVPFLEFLGSDSRASAE